MSNILFGAPEGVNENDNFPDRNAVRDAGLHRSPMRGIDGNGTEGVAAIVLSGGYEDDRDLGNEIVYTGHGGNDSGTGKQIDHQSWKSTGNAGLVVSEIRQLPVRVIRGFNHNSAWSPKTGYRYGGIYFVVEHWEEIGKSGFKICRFKLVKEDAMVQEAFEEVKEGVLVKVKQGNGTEKWFSIGYPSPPGFDAQQLSLEGRLAQEFLGRQVGDKLEFGVGFEVLDIKRYRSK